MPLNGGGTASKPAGTTAVPNTTITSAPFNSVIDDIYAIFNTPRPIVYGGTNGASAVEGIDNLSTKGSDIPSATTTDIGAATGRFVHITGTTTITGLGTKTAGVVRFVVFDGILTLTHNGTSLILPGAANITTAAGDGAIFVSEGAGNWRCIDYQRASGASVSYASPGSIFGLTLSNNATDAVNDIDISSGFAATDATSPTSMVLSAALTKRLDAPWAVGSGNGGWLDGASMPNGIGYAFLMQRSDTGVVDLGFSASLSPTLPTNYDRKRRIGFVIRSAGALLAFKQYGDRFIYTTPITDFNTTIGTSASPVPLTIPIIKGQAIVNARAAIASAFATVYLSGPDQADVAPASSGPLSLGTDNIAGGSNAYGQLLIDTNTGAIRARSSTAGTTLVISTLGFIDMRGRDG